MDTKEAIKVQFMNEYARKVFSDITVKGLCAATPVARTTFYFPMLMFCPLVVAVYRRGMEL